MTQVSYDAAKEIVSVFSPEGVEERVTRLNAHDLVRTNGYKWRFENSPKVANEPEVVLEALETLADRAAIEAAAALAVANMSSTAPSTTEAADEAPKTLAEIAEAVTGNADVAVYLKAFGIEALRTLSAERYGEKLHHRTSVDNAIARILELEEAKIAAESAEV